MASVLRPPHVSSLMRHSPDSERWRFSNKAYLSTLLLSDPIYNPLNHPLSLYTLEVAHPRGVDYAVDLLFATTTVLYAYQKSLIPIPWFRRCKTDLMQIVTTSNDSRATYFCSLLRVYPCIIVLAKTPILTPLYLLLHRITSVHIRCLSLSYPFPNSSLFHSRHVAHLESYVAQLFQGDTATIWSASQMLERP